MTRVNSAEIAFLQGLSTEMVTASGPVLYAAQVGGVAAHASVKEDLSLVTDDDMEAEKAAKQVWRSRTNYPILGEETGVSAADKDARILGMDDPIDGTRPRTNGAHTSVTMAGAYDLETKRFVAGSILHPISGTLVEASNGQTTITQLNPSPNRRSYPGAVWQGPLKGSTVLVDNLAPFNRGEHQERVITDKARIQKFIGGILDLGAVPQCYGSNGYHQLLLAKGGEKLAGAVMLSQGGPWDAIGLLAVENGGGSARAFQVQGAELAEQDPHDPFNWDILVLGNNDDNTAQIARVVEAMYTA